MPQPSFSLARKIIFLVNRFEEYFLCLLLFTMIVLACVQIALRSLLSSGLVWADPLLRYLVLWSGLLGAAVATRRGKHIAIDIISYLVPDRAKPWLRAVINLFAAMVAGVLTYAAVLFVRNEAIYAGKAAVLGIPSWVWNLIFPVAFALIALRFLVHFGENLLAVAGRQQDVSSIDPA